MSPNFFFEIRLKVEIFQKPSQCFFLFIAFIDSFPTACWLCLMLNENGQKHVQFGRRRDQMSAIKLFFMK